MPVKRAMVRLDQSGRGTVELDGLAIPGVRAVSVETGVGCLPTIRLEIVASEVDLRQITTADEGVDDAAPR